jgi:hypothetical protein
MADKVVKNALPQETGESIAKYHAGAPHINQQQMKPGTRVICINDDFPEGLRKNMKLPKAGETYTIRSIQPSPFGDDFLGYTLEGLDNRSDWFGVKNGFVLKELCFASFRFRPVDPQEAERWDKHRIDIYEPAPVSLN